MLVVVVGRGQHECGVLRRRNEEVRSYCHSRVIICGIIMSILFVFCVFFVLMEN